MLRMVLNFLPFYKKTTKKPKLPRANADRNITNEERQQYERLSETYEGLVRSKKALVIQTLIHLTGVVVPYVAKHLLLNQAKQGRDQALEEVLVADKEFRRDFNDVNERTKKIGNSGLATIQRTLYEKGLADGSDTHQALVNQYHAGITAIIQPQQKQIAEKYTSAITGNLERIAVINQFFQEAKEMVESDYLLPGCGLFFKSAGMALYAMSTPRLLSARDIYPSSHPTILALQNKIERKNRSLMLWIFAALFVAIDSLNNYYRYDQNKSYVGDLIFLCAALAILLYPVYRRPNAFSRADYLATNELFFANILGQEGDVVFDRTIKGSEHFKIILKGPRQELIRGVLKKEFDVPDYAIATGKNNTALTVRDMRPLNNTDVERIKKAIANQADEANKMKEERRNAQPAPRHRDPSPQRRPVKGKSSSSSSSSSFGSEYEGWEKHHIIQYKLNEERKKREAEKKQKKAAHAASRDQQQQQQQPPAPISGGGNGGASGPVVHQRERDGAYVVGTLWANMAAEAEELLHSPVPQPPGGAPPVARRRPR